MGYQFPPPPDRFGHRWGEHTGAEPSQVRRWPADFGAARASLGWLRGNMVTAGQPPGAYFVTGAGFSHTWVTDPSGARVRAAQPSDPTAQWVLLGPGGAGLSWVANGRGDDESRRVIWQRFRSLGGELPADFAEGPSDGKIGSLFLHYWDFQNGTMKRARYTVKTDGSVEGPIVVFRDATNPGAGWQAEGWDAERDLAYSAADLVKGFGTVLALLLGATGVGAGVGAAVGIATGLAGSTMDALKAAQDEALRRGILGAKAPPPPPPPRQIVRIARRADVMQEAARERLAARGFDPSRAAAQASLAARGFQVPQADEVRSATSSNAALVAVWLAAGAALLWWHRSRLR
jgi:hypothetical protein